MTLHPWDHVRLTALQPHGMVAALLSDDRDDQPPTVIWTGASVHEVRADITRRYGTAVADRCDIRPIAEVLK